MNFIIIRMLIYSAYLHSCPTCIGYSQDNKLPFFKQNQELVHNDEKKQTTKTTVNNGDSNNDNNDKKSNNQGVKS